jgi:biopolymer transport protein ExbD
MESFADLVDMTAMVDIVFFLLMFFLVTSLQALSASIPMPVPESQQAAPVAPQPGDADNVITVNIDEMDRVWVDGEEIANEHDLVAKLYELREGPGSPDELLIVGDGNATHGTAVMVHDSGNEVGISLIRLAIQVEAE